MSVNYLSGIHIVYGIVIRRYPDNGTVSSVHLDVALLKFSFEYLMDKPEPGISCKEGPGDVSERVKEVLNKKIANVYTSSTT